MDKIMITSTCGDHPTRLRLGIMPLAVGRAAATKSRAVRHAATRHSAVRRVEMLEIDGVSVKLTRKNMKSITLRVRSASGPVEVSAPLTAQRCQIEHFVRSRIAWIKSQRLKASLSTMAQANEASPDQVKQWRADVQAQAPALVSTWSSIMHVSPGKLAYRNMTSRWGSCQPATGRICLNVRLALYPPECLEYVVVHELCHLLERGHNARFYALMDKYLPDWQARKALLK